VKQRFRGALLNRCGGAVTPTTGFAAALRSIPNRKLFQSFGASSNECRKFNRELPQRITTRAKVCCGEQRAAKPSLLRPKIYDHDSGGSMPETGS
jgi:hypothetical protein